MKTLLESLEEEGPGYWREALASNTAANYCKMQLYFVRWLLVCGLLSAFADPSFVPFVLCNYVHFLARTVSYRAIKGPYLSAVVRLYLLLGLAHPVETGGFVLQQTLAGVRRVLGDATNPKRPITPALLLAFRDVLGIGAPVVSVAAAVVWFAMLYAFYGFFRKANVTAKASPWETNTSAPRRCDVQVDREAYVLWVHVRHTKTIQFGQRSLWIPMTGIRGHPLDVIAAYDLVCSLVPAGPEDHLFSCPLRPGGACSPLSHDAFVGAVKGCVAAVGLDPVLVAGHSFRRGGAAFAFHCKVPPAFIKLQGDWRSNAYLAYLTVPDVDKVLVTATMAACIVGGDLGHSIMGGSRVVP